MAVTVMERPADPFGAFCRHAATILPGADRGPLAKLTFAAKDIYDVVGEVTGCGNPDWLNSHAPARRTASAVQRLVDAGATMVAKTVTDELAFSLTGQNHHYGTPLNCRCPDRIPGGSSSGSAAAVAGGLVDFALGSDTGGSVRVPAALCGVFGFRPTHGRISLDGVMPLAPSFDTVGWFAPDAALLDRIGRVLLPEVAEPWTPRRAWLAEDAFAVADGPVAAVLRHVIGLIPVPPFPPVPVQVSDRGLLNWMDCFRLIQGAEIWATHGEWIRTTAPSFGPGVRQRFATTERISTAEAAAAARVRAAVADRLDGLLRDDAVLVVPSAPCVAPLKAAPAADLERYRVQTLSLTAIAGLARLPQVTLPLATIDGCPVGLSLIGPRDSDRGLLALARAIAGRTDDEPGSP